MSIEIPSGLTDLLQDFTVAVLRERPDDLVEFAAQYFTKLHDGDGKSKREVKFSEPVDADSDIEDEPPGLFGFFSSSDVSGFNICFRL